MKKWIVPMVLIVSLLLSAFSPIAAADDLGGEAGGFGAGNEAVLEQDAPAAVAGEPGDGEGDGAEETGAAEELPLAEVPEVADEVAAETGDEGADEAANPAIDEEDPEPAEGGEPELAEDGEPAPAEGGEPEPAEGGEPAPLTVIAGFAPIAYGEDQSWFVADLGTQAADLPLPLALAAQTQDDAEISVEVAAWECVGAEDEFGAVQEGEYDPDTAGTYLFRPVLAPLENTVLANGVVPPQACVVVSAGASIAPLATPLNGFIYVGLIAYKVTKAADANGTGGEVALVSYGDTTPGQLNISETATDGSNTIFTVTSIGARAFENRTNLTGDLIIPDSITEIGAYAFNKCSGFTGDLFIPDTVTSLGQYAFYDCTGFDGTLSISKNISSINDATFYRCENLTGNLTIPDNVQTIGMSAFENCKNLTGSLTIPANVTSLGVRAFSGCTGFTGTLTISDSVETIGPIAFSGCAGLTGSLTIPANVTSLGHSAFRGCAGFTGTLTIPDSLETIDYDTFNGCKGLTGSLTIPANVTSLGQGAFSGCAGFTGTLTIPDSFETINSNTFNGCAGFTGILTIPDSVKTIGNSAFRGCKGLTGITFETPTPNTHFTTLGTSAFYSLNTTGTVYYPDGASRAGYVTFLDTLKNTTGMPKGWQLVEIPVEGITVSGASGATAIETDGGTLQMGLTYAPTNTTQKDVTWTVTDADGNPTDLATIDTSGLLTAVKNGTVKARATSTANAAIFGEIAIEISGQPIAKGYCGITSVNSGKDVQWVLTEDGTLTISGTGMMQSFSSDANQPWAPYSGDITSLVIRDGVKSIGNFAFNGYSGLTGTLTIPDSVSNIGMYAFTGCSGFDGDLTIPDTVTTLGGYAFQNCSGFDGELSISSGLTTIPLELFDGCSGLTGDLVIPDTVTTINARAFRNCSGFNGTLSLSSNVATIQANAFEGCSYLTGDLTIPSSVKVMGTHVFYNCSGFDGELTLSNNPSLTTIPSNTFNGCKNLTGLLTIPQTVTKIDMFAFKDCSSLIGALTVPNSVQTIGMDAFNGCSGFTGMLTLPENAQFTSIPAGAFDGCTGLTETTIPENVTNIGGGAFASTGLTGITFEVTDPSGITIVSYAFDSTPSAGTIYYPDGADMAAYETFLGKLINTGDLGVGWKLYATPISSAAVTGIAAPATGAPPANTATGETGYTVSNVEWNPLVTGGKFLGSTEYTVTVTLAASNYYEFADGFTGSIGGAAAVVSEQTATSVKLSYTYAQTAAKTLVDIAVASQPSKMTYTHGDALDLSGLSVTLSYNDGTTEPVAAADFGDKGITASLADGAALSHTTHDGQTITLGYGGKNATTAALTVNPKAITITGVYAIGHPYNGSDTVALGGGELVGVVSGDDVSFNLGDGRVENANAGDNKPVETNITLTGTAKDNYTLTQPTGITVTITVADQGALVINSPGVITYGDGTFQLSTTGGSGGGTVTFELAGDAPQAGTVSENGWVTITGAGSITVIATKAADGNYNAVTSAPLTFTVNKKDVAIASASISAKTYDGTNALDASTVTPAFDDEGIGDSYEVSAASITGSDYNVGNGKPTTFTVALTGAADANYNLTNAIFEDATVDITTRALTITGAAATKEYDSTTAATVTSWTFEGYAAGDDDEVSVASSVAVYTGANAGTSTINVTSVTLGGDKGGNYSVTPRNGLTVTGGGITRRAVTITPASGQSKPYGTADPAFTFVEPPLGGANGLYGTDDFTGSLSRAEGSDVGSYAFTLGDLSAGPNYTLTLDDSVTFKIEKANPAVTWPADLAATYGQALSEISLASFSNTSEGTFSWTNEENLVGDAGPQSHSMTFTPTDGGNYNTLTKNDVNVEVAKRTLTITDVTATGRDYNGSDTVALDGGVLVGVVSGDDVDFILGDGTMLNTNAGFSKLVETNITLTGTAKDNYTLEQPSVTVDIAKVELTVTADDISITYGAAAPAYTYTVTGFASGEGAAVLGGTEPALSCNYVVGSDVDSYTITAVAGNLAADNYSFRFENGTLTVNAATVTSVTITGSAVVGGTLTVDSLAPTGATVSYQWKADGDNIGGATTGNYEIQAADLGKTITVTVTGTGNYSSSATSTGLGPVKTAVTDVTITGNAVVGETLSVDSLAPAGATVTYQWKANGDNIGGATGDSYEIQAADLGKTITVTVTGTGNYTGSVTSAGLGPVKTAVTDVTITGSAVVGQTLSVAGTTPTGATVSYQWKAGGTPISGATTASYTLRADDVGKTITVTVTGTGNYTGSATSTASAAVQAAAPAVANITAPAAVQPGQTLSLSTPVVTANGAAIESEGWELAATAGGPWSLFAPATPMTLPHNGQYLRYTATNSAGTTESNTVPITVYDFTNAEKAAQDAAGLDFDEIKGTNTAPDNVTTDLDLPSVGIPNDSDITWAASPAGVVDLATGEVMRPSYTDGDKDITLTATVDKDGETVNVTITITVKALPPTDAEKAAEDAAGLDWDDIKGSNTSKDNVTTGLTLPGTGSPHGSSITWAANPPGVVDLATGAVTRPAYTDGDKVITLTATVQNGSETVNVTITITVKALPQGGAFVGVQPHPDVPAVSLPNQQALIDAVLTQAEKDEITNDPSVRYELTLMMEPASADGVAEQKAQDEGHTVAAYYNITLQIEKFVAGVSKGVTLVTTLSGSAQIMVEIPEELRAEGRSFAKVRNHNGTAELLPDLDDHPHTLTIETDRFSSYVLVYKDAVPEAPAAPAPAQTGTPAPATTATSPQTGDSANLGGWLALLGLSGAGLGIGIWLIRWRRRKAGKAQ